MADVVKYGIQIPNRVFVGGVAFDTKEDELKEFFQQYGKVKDCKIVKDSENISRGFGFITFESKQDAIHTQQLGTVFYKQKKLNLGPAIRQKGVVFNGVQEAANEPVLSTGVYIHPRGYCYTVAPNGVWYFHNEGKTGGEVPQSLQKLATPPKSPPSQTASSNSHSVNTTSHVSIANISMTPPTIIPPTNPGQVQSLPQPASSVTRYPGGAGFVHSQQASFIPEQQQYLAALFQNMGISGQNAALHASVNQGMFQPKVPTTNNMHFNHVTEVLVPCYPGQVYHRSGYAPNSVPVVAPINSAFGSSTSVSPGVQSIPASTGQYQYHYSVPLQKQEYYTMYHSQSMEVLPKDALVYYPPSSDINSRNGIYKRGAPVPPPYLLPCGQQGVSMTVQSNPGQLVSQGAKAVPTL